MSRLLHCITLILAIAAASAGHPAASQTQLKASLDSAYLLMGRVTPLHVQLTAPAAPAGELIVPADTMCNHVEIVRTLASDTQHIANGRIQIEHTLLLQAFDSGTYILNPVLYVAGNETIASNRPVLKVLPVPVDSMATVHDYADVRDIKRRLVDYLPDFIADWGAWILAVILVLALGFFTILRLLSGKPTVKEKAKPIPPYELAMGELDRLKADKLCEQGREKEFYTRLTDILRRYLQGRFSINAMEMTSTQIRHTLQQCEDTRMSRRLMESVLETADFVKFAKVRPLPDDNTRAFSSATQFIEDTKPAPEPASPAPGADDADADHGAATPVAAPAKDDEGPRPTTTPDK